MSPGCASKCLQHLEALLGLNFNGSNMLCKGGGVKGYPENFGGAVDGETGLGEVDDGVVGVDLMGVASEEGDGGLRLGNCQLSFVCPCADVVQGCREASLELCRGGGRLQQAEVVCK